MKIVIHAEDHPNHGWIAHSITFDGEEKEEKFVCNYRCDLLVQFVSQLRLYLNKYNLSECELECIVKNDDDAGSLKVLLQDDKARKEMNDFFRFKD